MSLTTAVPASAPRLKKPSWKDPRLLLGIMLVLASTAGVVALVGSADQTTEVFVVDEDIPVGTPVSAEDSTPYFSARSSRFSVSRCSFLEREWVE